MRKSALRGGVALFFLLASFSVQAATVSGQIFYTDKEYNFSTEGAGYVKESTRAARYVNVELHRTDNAAVLASGHTDNNGFYQLSFSDIGTVDIDLYVIAKSDSSPWTDVRVINLSGKQQSVAAGPFTIDTTGEFAINYTCPSDLNGVRVGGIFNIVDCILQGAEQVAGIVGSEVPSLVIYWNDGASIWSSYLQGTNKIYLLGGTTGNPDSGDDDSYDDPVILHEYGHYLAYRYSVDKSPGGEHSLTKYYSPQLAWSEGWASGFSCLARNSSLYWDSRDGYSEGFNIDFESASRNGVRLMQMRSMLNEGAIAGALWDLFDSPDSNDQSPGTDDEPSTNNMAAVWTVFDQDFGSSDFATLEDFYQGWCERHPGSAIDEAFGRFRMEMSPLYPGEVVVSQVGVAKSIPDASSTGITETLEVPSIPGRVLEKGEVRCLVMIRHTNRTQLSVRLTHPDGTQVTLKAANPTSYGDDHIFEWYGYPLYEIPAGDLNVFTGKDPAGKWRLQVSDEAAGTTGTLRGWRLRIHQVEPMVFMGY